MRNRLSPVGVSTCEASRGGAMVYYVDNAEPRGMRPLGSSVDRMETVMDIQELVQTLVGSATENPDLLGNLMQHPYSTIGNLTNNNNVSSEEASQAVTAVAALAGGQNIDFGNLSSVASQLLSDNGGSVHNLAASLLGSGAPGGVDVSNGVSSDILSNIAGTVFSGGVAGVDLSDGIGLDDVMGFANFLMGKK